ncbi:MAG TPA: hypothetical protein VKU91_04440 [Acidimicrobiales bacterium]|nr:hypothetical protein [Acidimicrobiales bacterium]
MVLILLVVTVLGPFLLALGLLTLTRRCELWLEGGARVRPGQALADAAPVVAAVAAPAPDDAVFAA